MYKYKVINAENEVLINNIDLSCESDVLEYLKSENYKVIWIKKDLSKIRKTNKLKKIKGEDLQFFLYRLYILTSSNINLPKAMELLVKEEKNKNNKKTYIAILENLKEGNTLYNSIRELNVFSSIVINMIKIGEDASSLSEVFKNLSEYYKDEINFSKKVKSALYYPILLIIVTIIIVNFLTITILPQFMDLFYDKNNMPLSTRILMNISNFMNNNFIIILCISIISVLAIFIFIKTKKGKRLVDKLLIKSNFYRSIILKRFITKMCLLLNSNITLYNSLNIVSESVNNTAVKKEIDTMVSNLNNGMNFSESINNSKIFTELFKSLILVSEETARSKEIFNSLNKMYSYEIEIKEEKFIKLLEPIIIIILSFIVGFVVLSVAIPMFDIVNGI